MLCEAQQFWPCVDSPAVEIQTNILKYTSKQPERDDTDCKIFEWHRDHSDKSNSSGSVIKLIYYVKRHLYERMWKRCCRCAMKYTLAHKYWINKYFDFATNNFNWFFACWVHSLSSLPFCLCFFFLLSPFFCCCLKKHSHCLEFRQLNIIHYGGFSIFSVFAKQIQFHTL